MFTTGSFMSLLSLLAAVTSSAPLVNVHMGIDPFELYEGYNLAGLSMTGNTPYAGYWATQANLAGNASQAYARIAIPQLALKPNTGYSFSVFAKKSSNTTADCNADGNVQNLNGNTQDGFFSVDLTTSYQKGTGTFTTGTGPQSYFFQIYFRCFNTPSAGGSIEFDNIQISAA